MKKKNTFLRVGLVLTALVVGFIVLGLFLDALLPQRQGLFAPAAAVRRRTRWARTSSAATF